MSGFIRDLSRRHDWSSLADHSANGRRGFWKNVMINLFNDLPDAALAEVFTPLLSRPGCRIERIVSQGQSTPAHEPYRQAHDEWVVLLKGAARVALEGREVALQPGDTLFIPAHTEHWVTFTDPAVASVWLAIHFEAAT
ncbi:cupin domain-containing protein [Pseudomonas rhizoryzae]|uniref:cupin domain-containing protein n=1 Tax=Pseudomonas rhizoryzae TaxID=2571129 RepID=UPI001F02ABD0|nr:cupin domain-containing protein [Pseudomonas rhizoryzae]